MNEELARAIRERRDVAEVHGQEGFMILLTIPEADLIEQALLAVRENGQ